MGVSIKVGGAYVPHQFALKQGGVYVAGAAAFKAAGVYVGAGGGGAPAASFVAPANQTIFTSGVSNTITTSSPSEVFADGVSIGTASPTLSWTPGAVDLDVSLTLASGQARSLAVAAANPLVTALSSWTATSVTVAGAQTDYSGGTSAYRVTATAGSAQHYITRTPSPVMANQKTGFEITVKAGTNSRIMVYANLSAGNRKAIYDIASKQSFCDKMYVKEVEDMGNGFKRLWCGVADGQIATAVRVYHTNTFDPLTAATTTMAGTETFFALNPRMTDGPLPMTNYQKCGFWQSGTTPFGAQRWTLTTEFNSSVADMGQAMYVDVLLPDSYSTSNDYRVVYLMPVEAGIGATLANELEVVHGLGLHNSMNCIFVRPYFMVGGNRTWGGVKSDGTINHNAYISDMLPGFMDEFYSTIATREGRSIVGYSAGGFASLTQMNRRPDVWGYCMAWDCPLTSLYTDFDQAQHFGTEAQYNAYNPRTNFASANWNDKARLVFGGSVTFGAGTAAMYSTLTTALGNPLNNGGGDYATTITDPAGKWWKLDKVEASHNFTSAWATPGFAALQTLWGL